MSYKDDFESRSTLLNTYGNNALLLYALELRFEIADIFSVAGDALTDGGEDKKCDLIYIDQDTGIAVIAQGYMKQKVQEGDLAPENKASDLNTAAAWVFSQEPESVPERIRDQVRELQNAIKDELYLRGIDHKVSTSSWLISWNKKRKEKHNPDGISGRLQE